MLTKKVVMQRMIRQYREESGKQEVDMHDVANWMAGKGWELPKPPSPIDLLAQRLSDAAREEIRKDDITGKPYRANHAIRLPQPRGGQLALWIDIDEAPRHRMVMSLMQRREQMVGDGLQLSLDTDHWNRVHSGEPQIEIPLDFTDDIEWRKNAPDEDEKTA